MLKIIFLILNYNSVGLSYFNVVQWCLIPVFDRDRPKFSGGG